MRIRKLYIRTFVVLCTIVFIAWIASSITPKVNALIPNGQNGPAASTCTPDKKTSDAHCGQKCTIVTASSSNQNDTCAQYGLLCSASTPGNTTTGSCQPPPGLTQTNSACEYTEQCTTGDQCVEGICKKTNANGEANSPCNPNDATSKECLGQYQCIAPNTVGAGATLNYVCTTYAALTAAAQQANASFNNAVNNTSNNVNYPTNTPIPGVSPPCGQYSANGTCEYFKTAIGEIQTDIPHFVSQLFGVLTALAGGIALLIIIYAGFRYMVSQGKPEALQAAREQLIAAIVGLLFIIFSMVILQSIGVDILHIPGLK